MLKYILIALLLATPATAQQQCFSQAEAQEKNEKSSLYKAWSALDGKGQFLLEIWTRKDGFWVLLMVLPTGSTCLVSSGYFETPLDQEPEGVKV